MNALWNIQDAGWTVVGTYCIGELRIMINAWPYRTKYSQIIVPKLNEINGVKSTWNIVSWSTFFRISCMLVASDPWETFRYISGWLLFRPSPLPRLLAGTMRLRQAYRRRACCNNRGLLLRHNSSNSANYTITINVISSTTYSFNWINKWQQLLRIRRLKAAAIWTRPLHQKRKYYRFLSK
jgi:hypothetical protein